MLLTPRQVADELGVSLTTVKSWMRRQADPLPSVVVGATGTHRRILSDLLHPWLEAEAARNGSMK